MASSVRGAAGFTLIEVIGAVAAFIIAFLIGSAAFARLLQQQTINYHRTLASAAAMLLVDWHVDGGGASFLGSVTGTGNPLNQVTVGPETRFRGADYDPTDTICVFNPSADTIDLSVYGSLVVTLSQPAPREADSRIVWRQLSAWYGSPSQMLAGRPCNLEFVGRFLVPDDCTPTP